MGSKTTEKNRWKIENEEIVYREKQTERKSDAYISSISGNLNNNNMIDAVIIHLIV